MPLVIICYILANVSYFLVLPFATINSSNTVAVKFGAKVFGPVGSLVLALIVSASCFGALNSSTFTSSRLVYVAGREGYFRQSWARSASVPATPSVRPCRQRGLGIGCPSC